MAKRNKKFMVPISIKIDVEVWRDKKTGSVIYHSKKYDICGYGKTHEKAWKMFDSQVKNILLYTKPKKKKKKS